MRYRTIIIIALILAAALVVIFGWRPTGAAIRKVVTNLTSTTIKTANNGGLVGFWNFDDCDTCTTANDMSGNGNVGTITDANDSGLRNRVTGKVNNALSFDGTDDYVDGGNFSDNPTNLSVSLWFKSTDDNGYILTKANDTSTAPGWSVFLSSGKLEFLIEQNGSNYKYILTDGTYNDDKWHHVVATKDASNNIVLYIDGASVGSAVSGGTVTTTSNAINVRVGTIGSSVFFYAGYIDEARIYNRALSAAEVKGLFEGTKRHFVNMPQNDQLTDGLVGMWSFNGPDMNWALSTAEARDASGNANHGDVTNFGQEAARPGIVGQALSFDGTDEYVNSGTPTSLQLSNGTISAWVKTSNAGSGFRGIIVKAFAYSMLFGGTGCNDNTLVLFDWVSSVARCSGSANLADNQWHMVTVVFQSGITDGTTFYVDGSSVSNTTMTISAQTSALTIGTNVGALTFQEFNGLIDEARVYNRALSAAEITRLYNAGRRE